MERNKLFRGLRLATCVTHLAAASCSQLAPASSSLPSVDDDRDLTSFDTVLRTFRNERGNDLERFGGRRSTIGGPGDGGRPSTHKSTLFDLSLSLIARKSERMERRSEHERLAFDFSSRSDDVSRRLSIRSRRASSRFSKYCSSRGAYLQRQQH